MDSSVKHKYVTLVAVSCLTLAAQVQPWVNIWGVSSLPVLVKVGLLFLVLKLALVCLLLLQCNIVTTKLEASDSFFSFFFFNLYFSDWL